MASLDDILTAQKNGVVAINNLNQTMGSILLDLDTLVTDSNAFVELPQRLEALRQLFQHLGHPLPTTP